jgi:integrase
LTHVVKLRFVIGYARAANYEQVRNNLSKKLENSRLMQIAFKSFRHWKATTEYIRTKDIIYVKDMLGHVNINNTLKYIHLANAITDNKEDYVCKVAKTVEQAQEELAEPDCDSDAVTQLLPGGTQ